MSYIAKLGLLVLIYQTLSQLAPAQVSPAPLSNKPARAAGLVWDATIKEGSPAAGTSKVSFTFSVTNQSSDSITIQRVETSCGCTTVNLPTLPWDLEPKAGGQLTVNFDGHGKTGTLTKTILVYTSIGPRTLMVKVHMPEGMAEDKMRNENQLLAQKNRQTVFQGNCASCHVTPTIGKSGSTLYQTACCICHEAEHRASMVPDLKALTVSTSKEYWENWIRNGKPGTLMPAFEQKQGGPLSETQIQSLAEFLSSSPDFPSNYLKPQPTKPNP